MKKKNQSLLKKSSCSKYLLIFSLFSISSFSQDTIPGISENYLDDLVITASRTPEVKNQAAVTVQIINKAEIEQVAKYNADLTTILGLLVPGMGMQSNTVSNRSQTLRGRSALILIDGIPQSTPLRLTDRDLRSIDPSVIERIEIIKGATSIYGNGANGGIINVITKHNTSDKEISGSTTLGYVFHDFGQNMFTRDAGAGYKIIQQLYGRKNKFDYYLSGTLRQSGVSIDGENQVISPRYGLGETQTWNAFAKLGYQIDDDNRLELMYNFYNSVQNSKYIAKRGKYGSEPTIGVLGQSLGENEGTRYNHNINLKYIRNNIFENTNFASTLYFQDLYTIYDYRKPPRWFTGGQSSIKGQKYGLRFNFDTKLNLSKDLNSTFIYGVDALIDRTSQPLVDGRYWVPWLKGVNVAPYLQIKNVIHDYYVLKLGARFDYLAVDIPNYQTVPNDNNIVNVKGGSLNYNKLTFNAGFAYTQWQYFQPYISFSQGFSIYDLGRILRSANENTVSSLNTEPVVTNNYEFGFNSKINNDLSFSGSVFQSVAKLGADLISVDGFWVPERAPQKVWGWEVDAQYKIASNLNIRAAYSWQEGKADTNNDGTYNKYLSGLLIAPAKFNFTLNYQPIEKVDLSLYYIHSFVRNRFDMTEGKYEEGEGNVRPIDIFNLNVNYKFNEKFSGSLGVENLFNKTYYTQISMINARDAEFVRGLGRYIALNFTYKF